LIVLFIISIGPFKCRHSGLCDRLDLFGISRKNNNNISLKLD